MKKPDSIVLISIIIPVYNREDTLEQTLQTIADQIYRPIEVILVDNNSQDRSLEICHQFQETCSHLFFSIKVLQEPKKGANAARNTGLANATGDYVLFFDSDDKMYTDCISNIVGKLIVENFPNAVAYPFFIRFPDGKRSCRPHLFSVNPADQLFDTVIPTHGICIKRAFMDTIGPWDEQIERWQDLEFGFRVLIHIKDLTWFTEKPLYEVFRHKNSISGNSYFADHEIMFASLMKISSSIEKQSDSKEKIRQQRALCYRICSIGAQLRKEGHPETGRRYRSNAISCLPESGRRHAECLLRFQFLYEGKGGRGFWRIARKLL